MCNDLVNQVVKYAIPIFEQTHPNKIALFMFDNSNNYGLFAKDALLVSQMNIKDGIKKLLLRDSTKPDSFKHIITYKDSANFYCKLNYIEFIWAEVKCYTRLHCDYSFKGLKKTISKALYLVGLLKICHFARCFECFISAYELELSKKAANFAVKKYCSHHRTPEQ
ncbi:5860_t:CDS:2, partial [Dentiscutata heterogama]